MKAIKYVVMSVLMTVISGSAMAQDNKAVIEAATKIINSKQNVEAQLKPIVKDNKKNVAVLIGIGRAFLAQKDTANAQKYAQMAFQTKGGLQNAAAHLFQGDIYYAMEEGGKAASEYEQSIMFDDQNPEPYRKYAQIYSEVSPQLSEQKLNDLRAARPDYPVDMIIARIYKRSGKAPEKVLEYYGKVDLNNPEVKPYDFVYYANTYFAAPYRDFAKSLDIVKQGQKRYPRDLSLNRLGLYNLVSLERYAEAVEYADRVFHQSDSTDYLIEDYFASANALKGNKQFDDAINMFKQVQNNKEVTPAFHLAAMKGIADVLEDKNDYDQAIETYTQYLDGMKKENLKLTATDWDKLGKMHRSYAADLTGEAQADRLRKAADVYGQMLQMYPEQADYIHYMRGGILANLDPELKTGIAYDDYKRVAELVEAMSERSAADKSRLSNAYSYLFNYYLFLKDDKEAARPYLLKLVELNPDNEAFKTTLENLDK